MSVRDPTAAVEAMAGPWQLVTDLLGGTDAMRAAGKERLPQWQGEPDEAYRTRLSIATLFPAFARTVDVLTGKPFSKPVTLSDDVPARVREWADDVDLQGRDLHAFAAHICGHAVGYGWAGILVDVQQADGVRTVADERARGLRPYFVDVHARNLLGWRSARINGVETLTQLRVLECVVEPDGPFGEKAVEQVRVLYPDHWEVWREDETRPEDDQWFLYAEGPITLGRIPFVPIYGERHGFMQGRPPLLELAHLNVEHWQSKSDQQTILHIARVPILFGKGLADTPIMVGVGQAVVADEQHADLKYVEHSGAAIEAGRVSLLDLEDRMRQVGAELLVIKPARQTVAQTMADNEPGMCALQRIVQDLEHGLDSALGLMAEWVGEAPAGNVQIFQDFGVSSLADGSMDLLREMNVDGTLSDETLFHEAQRRGFIRPETVWEDEKTRIAQNRPKPGADNAQEKITD